MTRGRTYLGRLIDRTLGRAEVLEPLRPSRFEPSVPRVRLPVASLLAGERAEAPPRYASDGGPMTAVEPSGTAAVTDAAPGSDVGPAKPQRGAAPGSERHEERSQRLTVGRPRPVGPDEREALPAPTPARSGDPLTAPAPSASTPAVAVPPRGPAGPVDRQLAPPVAPSPGDPAPRRRPIEEPPLGVRAPLPLPLAARTNNRPPTGPRAEAPERIPAVHVTIGRIEVRAAPAPTPARAPAGGRASTAVRLDEYLRRREQERS